MFTCKRCNSDFSNKANLVKHLEKVTPCKVINDSIDRSIYLQEFKKSKSIEKYNKMCKYCEKTFCFSSAKNRHQNICKKNPTIMKISIVVEDNIDELKSQILKLKEDMKKQQDIIHKKDEELNHYKLVPTNITINNQNNTTNNNNTINIILRNYGDENMACLSDDLCVGSYMHNDIVMLIREMNFHPDFPENHNLDFSEKFMRKFLNGKWIQSAWNKGIHELIMSKIKVIEKILPNIIKDRQINVEDYLRRYDWSKEDYDLAVPERAELKIEIKDEGRAFTNIEDYLLENIGKEKQIKNTINEKALEAQLALKKLQRAR